MKCFVLAMCLITIFGGCKKEPVKDNTVLSNSIIGTWELRQSSGGIVINYAAGNGNILKFTNTGFEAYKIGQLDKSGQYSIVADPTAKANVCLVLPVDKFNNRIIFNGDSSATKRFVQITGDTLTFISGCFANDFGSSQIYKRE